MEKTFRRMMARPVARHAYVEAETVTALAHQIRIIRQQRGWTQRELAKRMNTTQAAISRLEDPSYGRISIRTLIDLSRVFDTGLSVKFISTLRMLRETWRPNVKVMRVPSFEDDATNIGFIEAVVNNPLPVVETVRLMELSAPSRGAYLPLRQRFAPGAASRLVTLEVFGPETRIRQFSVGYVA